jgi:hypothetical protein
VIEAITFVIYFHRVGYPLGGWRLGVRVHGFTRERELEDVAAPGSSEVQHL